MSFLVIRLFLNVWHIAGTRVNRWGRRGRLSRVRLPLASLLFLFILFYKWEIRPSYWICFRFIFMLCSWVFCLHVCVPHVYLVPVEAWRSLGSPRSKIAVVMSRHIGAEDLNSDLLQEKRSVHDCWAIYPAQQDLFKFNLKHFQV